MRISAGSENVHCSTRQRHRTSEEVLLFTGIVLAVSWERASKINMVLFSKYLILQEHENSWEAVSA